MAKLALNPIKLEEAFAFCKADNVLVGSMSQVGRFIGRIYDDSTDVGISVVGRQHTVLYVMDHTINLGGGDQITIFKPSSADVSRIGNLPEIRVFNT